MKKIQILAIASGFATFFLALILIKNIQKPVVQEIVREQIVIAAADITPYTEIKADMLSVKEVEADSIHQSTFRNMEEVIGRISTTTIFAGEPMLSSKVGEKESLAAGLALKVTPGKRAISIVVGVDTGVANNLRVGNWVDLLTILPSDLPEDVIRKYNNLANTYPEYFEFLASSLAQNDSGNDMVVFTAQTMPKAMMLLQDIKVLALDQNILNDYNAAQNMEAYASVTLEVTADQAMMIDLVENYHDIRLILRNQEDHEILETDGITLYDLVQEKVEEGE